MKTTKQIIAVLFVLLTAQIASAYYCPSTGRWLSRDPIGEPGFQVLQATTITPRVRNSASLPPARWIQRDPIAEFTLALGIEAKVKTRTNPNDDNTYIFVANDPVIRIDNLGLFTSDCASASPLKSTDCACDAYGNEKYPLLGVNLKCFCKCAGDSPWSQAVRGCLACSHAKGDDITDAHIQCYLAASAKYSMPKAAIFKCYFACGGILPPPLPPFSPVLPPTLGGF